MKITYLTLCTKCEPPLPIFFRSELDRDDWARDHEASSNHKVWKRDEGPNGRAAALVARLPEPVYDAMITRQPGHDPLVKEPIYG
jgi:hypothetical protein